MGTRMKKLSPGEIAYIEEGVDLDLRTDGRKRLDFRDFTVEMGVISQANGSARVRLDETDVLVGVKVDLGTPKTTSPKAGHVVVDVQCGSTSSAELESREADELNLELARVLRRNLNNKSAIDLEKLCVIEGKQCWIIYVDVLVVYNNGNLYDTMGIATKAALYDTRIPKIEVVPSETPGEMDIEVDADPEATIVFDATNVPICITLTKIGPRHHVVDPTYDEELCARSRMTVGINKTGNICTIQKGGREGVNPVTAAAILESAKKIGLELLSKLDTFLEKTRTTETMGYLA